MLNLYNITIDNALDINYTKTRFKRFKHLKYVKIKQGGTDQWFEKFRDCVINRGLQILKEGESEMKKRIITLGLCATLLFSSIAVMAGSAGTPFGAHNTGYASLTASEILAQASTTKYSGPGSCSTAVRLVGTSGNTVWKYGGGNSSVGAAAGVVGDTVRGESQHWIGNDYTSLSASAY